MAWNCFWVERNGKALIELRRYSALDGDDQCPDGPYKRYHNASKYLPRPRKLEVDREGYISSPSTIPKSATYPKKCDYCSYVFKQTDEWQANQEPLYVRPDTGEVWEQRKLPIGAIYDGYWSVFGKGKDGISLFVVLPKPDPANPGEWIPDYWWDVDGPARNHEGDTKPNAWTRTGNPRTIPCEVDVNPSILTPHYHGYLRHGVLTDPV